MRRLIMSRLIRICTVCKVSVLVYRTKCLNNWSKYGNRMRLHLTSQCFWFVLMCFLIRITRIWVWKLMLFWYPWNAMAYFFNGILALVFLHKFYVKTNGDILQAIRCIKVTWQTWCFSAMFKKGDTFCSFMFAILYNKLLLKGVLL